MNSIKTILVVEDEQSLLLVFRDRLKDEGYRILEALNGEEGLALALMEHPDLIILDLLMPVMDGVSMLKLLREDAWGKTAKVVVLTNLNEGEKLQEVAQYNVHDHLLKTDWKIEDVIAKLRDILKEPA